MLFAGSFAGNVKCFFDVFVGHIGHKWKSGKARRQFSGAHIICREGFAKEPVGGRAINGSLLTTSEQG